MQGWWRRRGGTQKIADALHRDRRLLPRIEHLRQLLDRRKKLIEIQQEGHDHPCGHHTMSGKRRPDAEHQHAPEVTDHVDHREVNRHESLGAESGVAVVTIHGLEAADVAILPHRRLGQTHTGQALLQVGIHRGNGVSSPVVGPTRPAVIPDGGQHQRRQHGRCHQRQWWRQHDKKDEHAHAGEPTDDGRDQTGLDQLRQ